jgi:hypothetical protein
MAEFYEFTVVFLVCRHLLPDCAVVWKKVLFMTQFLCISSFYLDTSIIFLKTTS